MKKLCLITAWSVLSLMCVFSTSISLIKADPSDDFSLTLEHEADSNVYQLMSEQKVATIFRDKLDLFPRSEAPKLAKHLIKLCKKYRFDPAFILALIQVESGFHVKIASPVGALGLMQLMPDTARHVINELIEDPALEHLPLTTQGLTRALFDPFVNISVGVAYLAWLRDYYRGHSNYFLVAAYNIGPGRLDELKARRAFRPTGTKVYYERIRQSLPSFRHYLARS